MERNGSYKEWLTLGSDDYDAWMTGIRTKTVLDDGLLAGLRMKGSQPGMEVKVPDEGNIYSIIATTGEQIQKKLNKLSPDEQKAISLDQTRAMADLLGENPEKLKKRFLSNAFQLNNNNPGQLAAQMVAAKDLLVFEIRKLDELADFVDGSSRLPEGVTSEQVQFQWLQQAELVANIQRQYKGAQTDIARAMSAFRIPARDDQMLMQRDYAKLIADVGGTEKIKSVIEGYKKEPDVARRANQVRQLSKFQRFTDSVHEVWVNSMLSGWRTHLKNTVGTMSALVADIAEMSAAATVEAPKVLWGGQRSITFGDVQAKIFGEMMAMREATSAAGRAFWLREEPLIGAEMSIISGSNPYHKDAISAENWNISNKAGARAIDFFGNLVTLGRAPTRMLQMGDSFNKIVAYRGTLWEEGYRAARQAGKKGEALEDFVADFVTEPPDWAAQKGLQHAKYVTLQSDFETGSVLHHAQKVAGHRFMRLIIPFYKTPTNSILYVGERSPFAPFFKRFRNGLQEGGPARTKAITRMAAGSAVMATLAASYDEGTFTGGISSDPRVRAAYARQGIKPYHMKVGDDWLNYNLLEPFSTIIGLIGDAMEVIGHADTDERTATEVWIGVAGVIGYNLQNKTFMQGLSAALEAMGNPARYGDKMLESYVRSFYPGSAALKDLRSMNDEFKRLRADLKDIYRAQLPGLSEQLEAKLDLWGRPIENSFFSSPYKPNKVDKEIVRLRLGLSKHPTQLFGEIGLETEEVSYLHERAGKKAFSDILQLLDPKTEVGKVYRKFQRASEQGDRLATDKCKNLVRKALLNARREAIYDLLTISPFADTLVNIIDQINQNKKQEGKELIDFINLLEAGEIE